MNRISHKAGQNVLIDKSTFIDYAINLLNEGLYTKINSDPCNSLTIIKNVKNSEIHSSTTKCLVVPFIANPALYIGLPRNLIYSVG